MKSKKVVVAVGILLIATAVIVANVPQSQSERERAGLRPAAVSSEAPAPAVAGVSHALKATYINSCIPTSSCSVVTLAAGTFVPLDAPTTISCSAAIGKTCTITDDAWIQTVDTSGTPANAGSITMIVDGVPTPTFYGGDSPATGGANFDGLYNETSIATGVSRGTHTVQTQARSALGAHGFAWTATYHVYVP
jgi:hypothetical protein